MVLRRRFSLRALAKAFRASFGVTVFLIVALVGAFSLFALSPAPAWADDNSGQLTLTLEQAIAMAKEHSYTYKQKLLEVDRTYEIRKARAEGVEYTPISGVFNPTGANIFNALLAADLEWQVAKRKLQLEEDKIEYNVTAAYYDALSKQVRVKAAEAALKAAEKDLQESRARVNVGLESKFNLTLKESVYKSALANLEAEKKSFTDSLVKLNQLIGINENERPVLVSEVQYVPEEILSLEAEINRVMDQSPEIFAARGQYEIQKTMLNILTPSSSADVYNPSYIPREAKNISVQQLEYNIAAIKEAYRIKMNSKYYQLKKLEEQIPALEYNVKANEESLRIAQVQYRVGMITKAQLNEYERKVEDAKRQYYEAVVGYKVAAMSFKKPWVESSM